MSRFRCDHLCQLAIYRDFPDFVLFLASDVYVYYDPVAPNSYGTLLLVLYNRSNIVPL